MTSKTFCLSEKAIQDWLDNAIHGDVLPYAGHGPGKDTPRDDGFRMAMRLSGAGLVSLVQRRWGRDCMLYEMQRTSNGLMP